MSNEKESHKSLFPADYPNTPQPSPQEIADINADFANQIGENAKGREVHYDDAPSDQVKEDLGLYRDVPIQNQTVRGGNISPLPKRKRAFIGPILGDESDSTTDGHHDVEYPNDDHKAAAAINVPKARAALTAGPEANDPDTHSPTIELPKSPEEIARIARGRTYADIIRRNWAANRKK